MSCDNIHKKHRERTKARFLAEGMDHLPPHNAMELLLFYAIPQGDVNALAHRLIDHFGGFAPAIDASYEQLLEVEGVGPHTASLLKLIPAAARYYTADKCRDICIDSTEKAAQYFMDLYLGVNEEQVYLACLDGKCKVLSTVLLHRGSVNAVEIHLRKLVQTALRCNAVGILVAHNHPGGIALPSQEDLVTTERIIRAVSPLGIDFVDHIIVADNDVVSLSQSGCISKHR